MGIAEILAHKKQIRVHKKIICTHKKPKSLNTMLDSKKLKQKKLKEVRVNGY